MVYNSKLKDEVLDVMKRRIASNKMAIEDKNRMLIRLNTIASNPDMINSDVAAAIIDKQASEVIGEEFGIDRNEAIDAANAQREAKVKADKEDEEANYQRELSRKRDAVLLEESAENLKLAREKERHRMSEEAANRFIREKIAVEESRARMKRQQKADEQQDKLFEENLELRKSIRKRLDAESNFVNSLAE